VQTIVLAAYLLAFACILCCFETHIGFVARLAAANFGFLYNAKGRAVFLLFIGILCLRWGRAAAAAAAPALLQLACARALL
jgi:COPI associated protein